MIWFGILVGSLMRSVEAVNGVMFTIMFPITFVANAFAPTDTMPLGLRTIAEWNPVSSLVQSLRDLWGNGPPAAPDTAAAAPPDAVRPSLVGGDDGALAPFALRAYARRTGG